MGINVVYFRNDRGRDATKENRLITKTHVCRSYRNIGGRCALALFCLVFTLNVNVSDATQDHIVHPEVQNKRIWKF